MRGEGGSGGEAALYSRGEREAFGVRNESGGGRSCRRTRVGFSECGWIRRDASWERRGETKWHLQWSGEKEGGGRDSRQERRKNGERREGERDRERERERERERDRDIETRELGGCCQAGATNTCV